MWQPLELVGKTAHVNKYKRKTGNSVNSMRNLFNAIISPARQAGALGVDRWHQWFLQSHHRFTITGLSRSGKSMLFTSLMTVLQYRTTEKYQCLPLLQYLPMEWVDKMWLEPLEDKPMFPVKDHLRDLENGTWPPPTETVTGFKLIVRLRQAHQLKKHLFPYTDVIFEFVDYPGEWLTDLPMLGKSYTQWSDSAWAQQMNAPQQRFAQQWHTFANSFDFEQAPTPALIQQLVQAYCRYLSDAKSNGISMLQPGSFLLPSSRFNAMEHGFTPLPSRICSDPSSLWTQRFTAHFEKFKQQWLHYLKRDVFLQTDKQIILVDLFEGLNHSRSHLYQLRETLSHLADTFVYGKENWFKRKVLQQQGIAKVAFVATKSDLIPTGQKDAMLTLLKDVTRGATARFTDGQVQFEHFLVSAIQATDEGSHNNALRYVNYAGQYIEADFESLPAELKLMRDDEHYPVLETAVPADYLARILNGKGLDRLLQFLLEA